MSVLDIQEATGLDFFQASQLAKQEEADNEPPEFVTYIVSGFYQGMPIEFEQHAFSMDSCLKYFGAYFPSVYISDIWIKKD